MIWNIWPFKIIFCLNLTSFGTLNHDCVIKTIEVLSFLPLINNSVTTGLSFLLLIISAIISLKTINTLRFIVGVSESGKTTVLLNLINNQPDIDKIYLYAKDPYEAKYQYLIKKRERVGLDHFNDTKQMHY